MRALWMSICLLLAPLVHAAEPGALPPPADVAAAPDDALRTTTGLRYKVLREGPEGPHPVATSRVTVHYTGWTTDGQMFDSSVARGQPAQFPLNAVIRGWTEGVQLMKRGDLVRMWIPEELAYQGQPGAPAGLLVFDVELVDFVTPPPTPIDVSRVPPVAQRSESGLAWRVLKAGTGTVTPTPVSIVVVQWSAWKQSGELIDSTLLRGGPEVLPMDSLPEGWSEALLQMVVGEKRRLWVPSKMAGVSRGFGAGAMIVFEIELVELR
jgi:FKBP-type peptidyl-prolyl cis-trans isomerase